MPLRFAIQVLAALFVLSACNDQLSAADDRPVLKVSVFEDGRIEVDGRDSDFGALRTAFAEHSNAKGVVWYYRAGPADKEPHPNAMAVIDLVIEFQLPVSLSGTPDFSTVVAPDGTLQPRD